MRGRYLLTALAGLAALAMAAAVYFAWSGRAASTDEKKPLATVAGRPIYEDDLRPRIERDINRLRTEEYEIKTRALEELIGERLLEAEAARRSLSVEALLEAEAYGRVALPSDEEVSAFYESRRGQINRPLDEVRELIRQGLREARREQAREQYVQRLRGAGDVVVLLRPPRVSVAADPRRLRGPADAPVTIVEFSDYQCPFCRRAQPTLQQVLEKYQGRVAHAFRDFPLDEIHPQARAAAEAARCAADQGKFWEYHTRLFERFGQLDRSALVAHAEALGLRADEFTACLASGRHRAGIEQDFQEGRRLGVEGTPAFFINGILLGGARPFEEFDKIISAELAAKP